MNEKHTQEFPYSMDTAWNALHKTSYLDIDAGSRIERISDDEWDSFLQDSEGRDTAKTHYTTTYEEASHKATIEGVSDKKLSHDYIYLTLTPVDDGKVSLSVDISINTGVHFIAHILMSVLGSHMKKIITQGVFENFDALCQGKETKRKDAKELADIAGNEFTKK